MDPNPFAAWEGREAPLVTDGGEAGAGADHGRAALLRALALGARGAALSVRLSSDGVPVLFRLPRTGSAARGRVAVAETTADDLRRLRLKGDEPPLFLDEALSLLPPSLPLLLSLLVPGAAAAAAPLLGGGGGPSPGRPLAILSPLRGEIVEAGRLLPGVPRLLLAERPSLSDLALCARNGLGLAARASALTAVRCARMRKDGVSFLAHGVGTPELRDRAVRLGARALLTRRMSRLSAAPSPVGPTP